MDLSSLGGVGKAIARVETSIAQDVLEREAAGQATPNATGPNIIRELELAAIAFVTGAPVKFKVDTQGAPLEFTAKDELGIEYKFVVNGSLSIDGAPQ